MQYRGLFYFIVVSCFLYLILFSQIVTVGNGKKRTVLLDKLVQLEENTPKQRIVETFIELENPEKSRNVSNLESRAQGKITEEEGYSYYNDIRYFSAPKAVEKPEEKKSESLESQPVPAPEKKEKPQEQKKVDILPNQYTRKEVVVNLNSDGWVGVAAEKKEYVEYLVKLAKTIFYNWVEFVPAMQINQDLIKKNSSGNIQGTIGIYFNNNQRFEVVIMEPFASPTMNNLTGRSFQYLSLPSPPERVTMNLVIMQVRVSPLTLRAEAEFKFDFDYKEKNKSQKEK
jgi:hypothetical protein